MVTKTSQKFQNFKVSKVLKSKKFELFTTAVVTTVLVLQNSDCIKVFEYLFLIVKLYVHHIVTFNVFQIVPRIIVVYLSLTSTCKKDA